MIKTFADREIINDQWRICFRYIDGDAYDVQITDHH
jgi:proteic killer suppression protein